MKKYLPKIALIVLVAILAGSFFALDLGRYFTLENLKSQQETFKAYYQHNQGLTLLIYFSIYVLMAALSLPGAAVMTLAGGALFGRRDTDSPGIGEETGTRFEGCNPKRAERPRRLRPGRARRCHAR